MDLVFRCMGTDCRVVADAAERERAWLHEFDHALSRFRPDSELCALNADPRRDVPASALLRAAVGAGLWAAERTGGLVDPTLVEPLEAAGYEHSLDGVEAASLAEALACAPPRRPAAPGPARWRAVSANGVVRRPPGLRLDTGGTGKGLAADAVVHRLRRERSAAVDLGGDLRVSGELTFPVDLRHPLTGEIAHTIELHEGAVATSGLDARVWRTADGGFAHHLLDPATGTPAWTGLIAVTALAPTVLEAETLAKAALLSGPRGARHWLAQGGILIHDDGDVEVVR